MRGKSTGDNELDTGLLLLGLVVGLLAGGVLGLLNAPRPGRATRHSISASVNQTSDSIRHRVESAIPSDTLEDSIAEGKAAARRRLTGLGIGEA